MEFKVSEGKSGKVKISEYTSLSDILEKVEEHANCSVPMDSISMKDGYALYNTASSSKIVTLEDSVVISKIKALLKAEAGFKTSKFEVEILNTKK